MTKNQRWSTSTLIFTVAQTGVDFPMKSVISSISVKVVIPDSSSALKGKCSIPTAVHAKLHQRSPAIKRQKTKTTVLFYNYIRKFKNTCILCTGKMTTLTRSVENSLFPWTGGQLIKMSPILFQKHIMHVIFKLKYKMCRNQL